MGLDKLYRSFLTVVETDTLVQAAERLHVTQPTLSRQIQQLEAELGTSLFDRIGKRMILNEAGQMAYRAMKQAMVLEDGLRTELESLADPDVGLITLGVGLTPSIHHIPPILAQYRSLHPRVRFQVRTGSSRETLSWLRAREVDVAVVTTLDGEPDDLAYAALYDDPLWLVAAPEMSSAFPDGGARFASLSNQPFVLMREGSGLRRLVEQLADEQSVGLWVTVETDSLEGMGRLVQQGVGLSILPASSVREDIQMGRLVRLHTDVALPARTVQLVVQRNRFLSAAATKFITWFPKSEPLPL